MQALDLWKLAPNSFCKHINSVSAASVFEMMFGRPPPTKLRNLLPSNDKPQRKTSKFGKGEAVWFRDYKDPNNPRWLPGSIIKASGVLFLVKPSSGPVARRHANQIRSRLPALPLLESLRISFKLPSAPNTVKTTSKRINPTSLLRRSQRVRRPVQRLNL
ncbi:hypothetical protein Ciccas_009741 [Cichlidogyrus casuarinus]|uniref:Uncharacterized protein n=1 Tax=Cichlidogyrus casuarinus TaxID=1844966 RepID=A0ABD2PXN3_9PLAT